MVQNKPNPWSHFLAVSHDQIYKVVENFYLSYLCSYGTAVGDVSEHQKIININGNELKRHVELMNLYHFDRTIRQQDLDDIIGDEIVVKGCTKLTDNCEAIIQEMYEWDRVDNGVDQLSDVSGGDTDNQ